MVQPVEKVSSPKTTSRASQVKVAECQKSKEGLRIRTLGFRVCGWSGSPGAELTFELANALLPGADGS